MKVFCKKLIICLLVFVLLFNFTFQPQVQAATAAQVVGTILDVIASLADGLVGVLTWLYRLMAMIGTVTILGLMTSIATTFGYVNEYGDIKAADGTNIEHSLGLFTPDDIFFNKILLTDANVFKIDSEMPDTIVNMRSSIALWYLIMRIIAISILLGILIFIAIRMAISVVASEKAKYKEMLVNWATSIGLVFLLHYVIIGGCALNSALVGILSKIYSGSDLEDGIAVLLGNSLGMSFVGGWTALIVVLMITVQTLAFMVYYIKRMLTISFLTIISPLITITYSIDKLGDGKAQALNTWMKEFFFTIVIQPFHCIIYMVFMSMAISAFNPITPATDVLDVFGSGLGIDKLIGGILAILCIKFVWDAEKVIKNIFGIKVSESLGDAVASAAVAGAVVSKTMGMAKGAAGAAKGAKQLAVKSGLADKLGNTALGKKVGDLGKRMTLSGKMGNVDNKLANVNKELAKEKAKGIGGVDIRRVHELSEQKKKLENKKQKYQDIQNGRGVRGAAYQGRQKIKSAVGSVKDKFDKMDPERKQRLKRHLSNATGVAAAVMGASMTYGASDKTSLFEAGIAGYGAYGGIKNATLSLLNRKKDNFTDEVQKDDKMLCNVRNQDPDKRSKSDIAEDRMYASVRDQKGDFKNLSDDRKKTKEELLKALQEKDRQDGKSESDIAAKSDYYDITADKAMKALDNGIYNKNLDCDKIAAEAKLDPSVFRGVIADYAEDRICKNMATDNANLDALAGMDGYHAAVLQDFAGQEIDITERNNETRTETETETETIIPTPTPAPVPPQNPNPLQSVTTESLAKEIEQYKNSPIGDADFEELLDLVGYNEDNYEAKIEELRKDIESSMKLAISNLEIEKSDVLDKIDFNKSNQTNVKDIVEEIKTTHNIKEIKEETEIRKYVTRIVRQEKFNKVMEDLNKTFE